MTIKQWVLVIGLIASMLFGVANAVPACHPPHVMKDRLAPGIYLLHRLPSNAVEVKDPALIKAAQDSLVAHKVDGSISHLYTVTTARSHKQKLVLSLNGPSRLVNFSPALTKSLLVK